MASGEAGDAPTRSLTLEVLLVIGDEGPGEFVSNEHGTRVRP
jgi:hypothetical protein